MIEKINPHRYCVGLFSKGANAKSTKGVLRVIVNDLIVLNNTFLRIRAIILILSFICILLPIILLKHLLFPEETLWIWWIREGVIADPIVLYHIIQKSQLQLAPAHSGQELLIL